MSVKIRPSRECFRQKSTPIIKITAKRTYPNAITESVRVATISVSIISLTVTDFLHR